MSHEPELLRPETAIPLAPLRGPKRALRRYGTGLREPEFARAQLAGVGCAGVPLAMAMAGLLVPSLRAAASACAVVLGTGVLARSLLLVAFERLQHLYERRWLAEQTAALRGHDFPLLRCAVHADDAPGPPRGYDLTSGDDVCELLGRREQEHDSGTFSHAMLQFVCAADWGELTAVAEVRRGLAELEFLPAGAGLPHAWVRFPEACYLPLPDTGRWPARQAYWVLSGPVLVSSAEATARTGPAR
jgi:hypothetical protein